MARKLLNEPACFNVRAHLQGRAVQRYGMADGQQAIKDTYGPPIKRYGNSTGNIAMFYLSGVCAHEFVLAPTAAMTDYDAQLDLGHSDIGMTHIHYFCDERRVCEPERKKPAIRRRRGESAVDWLRVSLFSVSPISYRFDDETPPAPTGWVDLLTLNASRSKFLPWTH
jgi:hypothetical protein